MSYAIHCKLVAWIHAPKPQRWWESDGMYRRRAHKYQLNAQHYLREAQAAEGRETCALSVTLPYGKLFDMTAGFPCPEYGPYESHDTAQLLVDGELTKRAAHIFSQGLIGPGIIGCLGGYKCKFFVVET